jgi:hypothetical protein
VYFALKTSFFLVLVRRYFGFLRWFMIVFIAVEPRYLKFFIKILSRRTQFDIYIYTTSDSRYYSSTTSCQLAKTAVSRVQYSTAATILRIGPPRRRGDEVFTMARRREPRFHTTLPILSPSF